MAPAIWRIRSFPGEQRRICPMSKKANPRPITAQTRAMGTPAVRRFRARIVMVARKAHDFMVKTLTGNGYLPRARTLPAVGSSECKHLLQPIEEGRPVFLLPGRVFSGPRFFHNPFRLEASGRQNL